MKRSFYAYSLILIVAGTVAGLAWSIVFATAASPTSTPLPWSGVQNLSHSGDSSDGPVVAAFSDTVHVVWVETSSGQPEIYHIYKSGDNEWSAPAPVEAGIQPDLAVGPDGTFDLVWVDEGGDFIRYRRWDNATLAWVDAYNVALGGAGTLQAPAVAVGPGATVDVVWVDLVTNSPRIRHRRRMTTGWDNPENVPGADGITPDVSVDSAGELHIVWAEIPLLSDTFDIYYLWKDPELGWSEAGSLPRVLSTRQGVDNAGPAISRDSFGILYVSWQESSSASSAILHRAGRESSWLTGDEEVTRRDRAGAPAIVVDEQRVAHLAFAGPDGIEYYTRSLSRVWRAGDPIAVDQPAATAPDLAAAGGGILHAVWTAPGVAGQPDVFYRGMGPGISPTQTATFTPTTVATTSPTVTLTPSTTSTTTTTPTATSTPTSTPTVTSTPTLTLTPTATWTPSPTPTEAPQRAVYLPLVLKDSRHSQANRTTDLSSLTQRVVCAIQRSFTPAQPLGSIRVLPLCLGWSRMS